MLQKANEQYHKASDFPQDEKPYRKVEDQRWKIKPAEPIGLLKLVFGISALRLWGCARRKGISKPLSPGPSRKRRHKQTVQVYWPLACYPSVFSARAPSDLASTLMTQ